MQVEEAVAAGEYSSAPGPPGNSFSTPEEVQASLDALLGIRTEPTNRGRLSSSPGDPFVFDYSSAKLERVKEEEKLTGGIYDGEKEEKEKSDKKVRGDTKKSSQLTSDALTPVTNQSIGALIPVALGHNSSVSDDGTVQSGEEEPPSPKPDYALAGNSSTGVRH